MIDALILNYNDAATTTRLVGELEPYDTVAHILVVDNCSTDDSYEALRCLSSEKVRCISTDYNGGYGYGNNYGVRYARRIFGSDCILLCNPDVHVSEAAIVAMENHLRTDERCAICAPLMCDMGGGPTNNAFRVLDRTQYVLVTGAVASKLIHARCEYRLPATTEVRPIEVDTLSGSLFMLSCDRFLDAGAFDENLFLYGEEIVLGMRIRRAGYVCHLLPWVTFVHEHSVSISKTYRTLASRRRLMLRSKYYIARTYYGVSKPGLLLMHALGAVSYVEEYLIINVLRRFRARGAH